ncbi:MAG: [protein-PII] uridylyltransferase [Actinobacteria bacterium]|nr:[protein-PII] uridylyltransferase [Actinomycetota bacterium]
MGTRERRERSDLVDRELSILFSTSATEHLENPKHVALSAVGGYGRGELAPGSDLDLLILHDGSNKAESLTEFVNAFLYPLWNSGRSIDHSVRTRSETREAAESDVRVATGLLDIRFVAGNADLVSALGSDARENWRKNYEKYLPNLRAAISERSNRSGELAFLLEPDLKEARGGLRDINALRAIELSGVVPVALDRVAAAEALLSNVRDVLHEVTPKPRDQLMLTEQDRVAEILEFSDADALMLEIAKSARAVDYVMDLTWHRIDQRKSTPWFKKNKVVQVTKGLITEKGELTIEPDYKIAEDCEIGLRAAATAAQSGIPLSIDACIAMAENFSPLPTPWPRSARENLVALIGAGNEMVRVFEALDQEGIIEKWLPEWSHVRFLPQRNVLHHHTVDRHMLETAVRAATLTRTVKRPDLLLVAALFHDIGKGFTGKDHSEYGGELIAPLALRIGFSQQDSEVLALLVREHLLLSTVATRRDLNDPATISFVIEKLKDPEAVLLLHALSISDGEATGRTAWSDWKAGLVSDLVDRTLAAMSGVKPLAEPELASRIAQDSEFAVLVSPNEGSFEIEIVARDRTGLLSVIAGVLSISRLDVRSARTRTINEQAVMKWIVTVDANATMPSQEKLTDLFMKGLQGELDIASKIDERINSYRKYPGIPTPPPLVSAMNDIATNATVIEVRMHDRPGVLFSVAKAISRFGVDIRAAIVSTLGAEAFDTLYVTDLAGQALTEERAKLLANQVENILSTHL